MPTTRRIAPVLLCLLLLLSGTLCFAFCPTAVDAHACCHPKSAATHAKPCCQSPLAQSARNHAFPVPVALVERNDSMSAYRAPGAGPQPFSSPRFHIPWRYRVLRI
jgi:hypothetical protein